MTVKRLNSSYIHSIDNPESFGTNKNNYKRVSSGIAAPIFFTSNGSWTRPIGVEYVDLIMVGGGGGGGAGNYGGGGGGGNVYYIKKFYVGDYSTWYVMVGQGGAGGNEAGVNGTSPSWGDTGYPTVFSPTISSYTLSDNTPFTTDPRTIICPGGGGGGAPGNYGFFTGTGGGSGSGAGFASYGRISGSQYWHAGYGYNGGAGNTNAGGGGGSSIAQGGAASSGVGGTGADGPLLQAPLPDTFVNSAAQTISTRFGGGGGGSGSSSDGAGGAGGGASGKNVTATANTGGGGSGNSGNGGSGILIIMENRE